MTYLKNFSSLIKKKTEFIKMYIFNFNISVSCINTCLYGNV